MRLLGKAAIWVAAVFCLAVATTVPLYGAGPAPADDYYTEPPLFGLRPNPKTESKFGIVGVTGLKLRVFPGVVLKVEESMSGTPADGKFKKGEMVTGVNGIAHKGRNPYVVFGEALTRAEATDGKLVFDVVSADGNEARQVEVVVPVLGAYSPTWPLNCSKSQAIVKSAAESYVKHEKSGVEGALRCLFLLSTGDDLYLPAVKAYLNKMGANVQAIGDCTWSRGYNGLACAEYYLRTGDPSVLPLLQHFCDDAVEGQAYGLAWAHGTHRCNPNYMDGLMNPASAQLVTTLLLGRECGIHVDEKALLGALKYFYRFAGHGAVPYGEQRCEGLGSNGKDGMAAAIMQIASGAQGNVDIYRQARDRFAMSMIDSYASLSTGHADDGRGDAIWRGISVSYLLDIKPAAYQSHQDSLRWWYDLCRRPSGAFGISSCQSFDDEASGAGVALTYAAPLKTLRITGAPRSKHAADFTLPEKLWGRQADLDFLSVESGTPYKDHGSGEPIHIIAEKLGEMYSKPSAGLAGLPREEIQRNAHHQNYVIRAQACKALRQIGAFEELEKLLNDTDPRVRRAALDGLVDYKYWFFIGSEKIGQDKVTPGVLASLRKMLTDPEESIYVVDGALMVMSCASPATIVESLSVILPWTTYDEWWVRQSAFTALAAVAEEAALASNVLPTMGGMLWRENRPTARGTMTRRISQLARKYKPDSETGVQISAIFKKAVDETRIDAGFRGGAGGFYVKNDFLSGLNFDPSTSLELARLLKKRLPDIRTDYLVTVVEALLAVREKLPDAEKQELVELLYGDYRQDLIRRMDVGNMQLDMISSLTQLKDKRAGWRELGCDSPANRVWQFASFEPQVKDSLSPLVGKRFRDVTLPTGLEQWYMPGFDAGKWSSGKSPIGKGEFTNRGVKFENRSIWGDGEFLLVRSTFELDALDFDFVRIAILANQGYRIYLNGVRIGEFEWARNPPQYFKIDLAPGQMKLLGKGSNVIAVYANAAYKDNKEGEPQIGQFDMRIEGLRKADLIGDCAGDAE